MYDGMLFYFIKCTQFPSSHNLFYLSIWYFHLSFCQKHDLDLDMDIEELLDDFDTVEVKENFVG